MYTPIAWTDDREYHKMDGTTLVFTIDEKGKVTTYPHTGQAREDYEVYHSHENVFQLSVGPCAINKNSKKAWARLNPLFEAPEDCNRWTVLCGEEYPELEEVEIYHLVQKH